MDENNLSLLGPPRTPTPVPWRRIGLNTKVRGGYVLPSKGSFTATALPGCMSPLHATVLSAMRQPILADEAELLSRSQDQRVAWHLPRRNGVSRQGNRGRDRVQRGSVGQCHGGSAQGGLRSVRILAHLHGAKVAGHLLRRADSPQGIHRGGPTGPRGAGPCPGRRETRVRRADLRSCGRRKSGRDLWLLGLAASERDRTRISRPIPNGVATPSPRRSLVKKLWRNHRFKVTVAELFDALKRLPDYARSSARSGGLARAAVFLGSRASVPADGAHSVAFASLPRAGSPRSQEGGPPLCEAAGPG